MIPKHPRLVFRFLLISFFLFFPSCSRTPETYVQTFLILYRFSPPAFVEYSRDLRPLREIPFSIPPSCSLFNVFPAPAGKFLLVELGCPNGQTVLFLDTGSGAVTQPVTESDAHFLAWAENGRSAYLKIDSLGNARVVRISTAGRQNELGITGWTYDLAPRPGSNDFVFSFSRGLGAGSELHLTQGNGQNSELLYKDPYSYISFARFSPDASRIAFIKIPDSTTPFTMGELWVMAADGSSPRNVAEVDAGHGYAANWSLDGQWIAFVKRENVQESSADQTSESLISNIYVVNVQSGEARRITSLSNGQAETPAWSPEGNTLAFTVVINGRMEVQIADIATGEIHAPLTEPACCPAWIRK